MNLNPLPWLRGCLVRLELPHWTATGIVQPEQAARIDSQYDKTCCGWRVTECARLSLFAMAAASVAFAVLLIVAHQWKSIHFLLKLCIALILMAVAHGTGYWYRVHMNDVTRSKTCFLLGTMLYGLGLLLVGNHVGAVEFYPWAFFLWAAGTLPLAWVLSSLPLLLLCNLLGTVWFVWHMLVHDDARFTSLFVAQALCLIRWSYANRARDLLIATLLSLTLWWVMLTQAPDLGRQGFFWIAGLGPLLYLVGLRHGESDAFASVYKNLGLGITGLSLLALAMPSVSIDLMEAGHRLRYWLCLVAVAGAVFAFAPAPRALHWRRDWPVIAVLAAVSLVPGLFGLASFPLGDSAQLASAIALVAIFNTAVIAVVVASIKCGVAGDSNLCIALGVAYFAAWAVLVTCDLAHQLLVAVLIFAVAAAVLLATARLLFYKQASGHDTVSVES